MATEGAFVYHRVPVNLRGSVLLPLNDMEHVWPDLYEELRQNYATRPDIAALRIPPLGNCLWNDVLFFSPVHPATLRSALLESGHDLPTGWRRYFQIEAGRLDPTRSVIYPLRTVFWPGQFDVEEASAQIGRECLPFDLRTLAAMREVPAAARAYYASTPVGAPFPLFLGVPHVLYRGHIDLAGPGINEIEV